MRNLLDSNKCPYFLPTFDNRECKYYQYAENDRFEQIDGACGFCKRPGGYRCVADITRIVPLSHSSVSTFMTCHQLYYLQKILGIEKRPAFMGVPLKAGSLWDTIKQRHLGADKSIKDKIEEYEIDPITVSKVRALYHAYKEFGITVDSGFELQAAINFSHNIQLSPSSFIPSVDVGEEKINLWADRRNQGEDNRTWIFPLSVTGFYDRKYSTYFCEDKLSGKPKFYLDPFYIQSQMGTYFLADPNLEYVIMEVVLFPQQRELKKPETPEAMYERVYGEILSRPSKYFIGFDRKKLKYGVKFHRGEFDLDAIVSTYQQVVLEILSCRYTGNFYKNFRACNNIFGYPCEYQTICKTGNISESLFRIRKFN